jgi:hypothetical protein
MTTLRVERRQRFTIVDNTALEDERLSFKAVGLLAFLLSKPDGWTISYRQLAGVRTDGEHSVRQGLSELEAAGYLTRRKIRLGDGTVRWESVIRESSASAEVAPCGDYPRPGKPRLDNRRRSKDCLSKDPLPPKNQPLSLEEIAAKYGVEI